MNKQTDTTTTPGASSTLPAVVNFDGTDISVIPHEGQPWMSAADLARALGYARTDSVSRVYSRSADEFTEDMSRTLTVADMSQSAMAREVRIFSARGCHLLAMLSDAPKGKAFRRWVLDVLEGLFRPQPAPVQAPVYYTTVNTMDRQLQSQANPADVATFVNTVLRVSGVESARFVLRHYGVPDFREKSLMEMTWEECAEHLGVELNISAEEIENNSPPAADVALVKEALLGLGRGLIGRDDLRAATKTLSSAARDAALAELCALGVIEAQKLTTGKRGRPTTFYRVSQKAH